MNHGFHFGNSGTSASTYARPYSSCVWPVPRHRSPDTKHPHFAPPSLLQAPLQAYRSSALSPSANSGSDGEGFNPHNRRAAA
jgi:hypothetical protein